MIERLVECPADGPFESVAGGDQLGPLEDQPTVGPTATEPLARVADRAWILLERVDPSGIATNADAGESTTEARL